MKMKRAHHFKDFFHHFWLRTLKIDILTLFISLTILTFVVVICYSYLRNYHAILNFSKGTMERNSAIIIERIKNTEGDAEQILHNTSGLLLEKQIPSVEDPDLQIFMLNVLRLYSDISSLYLAFDSGDLISVQTINSSIQTHFLSAPEKPLPANAIFTVQIINTKRQAHPEIWYYLDSNLKVIASEELTHTSLDVKTRPWFKGAIQSQKIYWSDVYHFLPTQELGLTASKPIYDRNNKLICVMGTDISFKQLTDFMQQQKIGKIGSVFLLDQNAKIIIPRPETLKTTDVPVDAAEAATAHFAKTSNHNFSFEFHHARYLVYISNLPSLFHQHWQLMSIVPFSEFFGYLIHTQFQESLITLIILLFSILIIIYFSNRISKPIVRLAKEIDKITSLDLSSEKRISSHIIEIRMMDISVASLRAAIRSFSHYVPKEIVKQLLSQGQEITLHVSKKRLTIFFSDIENFTAISETYSLNILMPLLNEYFHGLSTIILQNNGTIDKYIGDSVMAFWGAPLPELNHAILACKTALQCQAFLVEFNKKCRNEGKPEFITRFGISTGTVVVGNIGTLERMNYTVMGDTVNTAARLQVTDKIYHVSILISDEVYHDIAKHFLVRPIDIVEIRGKKNKIKIYELVASADSDPIIGATSQQKELCSLFTAAYQQFTESNYEAAKQLFIEIQKKFPDDYPTQFYLKRFLNR